MFANLIFGLGFVVSVGIGFVYFRDLGDVTQLLVKVKRENLVRFVRNEKLLLQVGLGAAALAGLAHLVGGGGPRGLFWLLVILVVVFYAIPYVYLHYGLRNQQNNARFYPIEEAKKYLNPTSQVIVMENDGAARAHPQAHIMRPHLAGDDKGLGGEDVIITFCAMANLGVGYAPAIEGQRLDLEVIGQHGNNLILRDNTTGEPIQQIYGFRERDTDTSVDGPVCPLKPSLAMKPWPTFRMTFRGFQKAYPNGEVFLNKPPSNPFLWLLDFVLEIVFSSSIDRQHREDKPLMDNMSHYDDRLGNKTYVWGVNIGSDAACWTDDFVVEQGNVVNAEVGGQALTIAWDPKFESLNVFVNDTGKDVTAVDFFGKTASGQQLARSADVKPGMFWHVWAEFFPHTDINRVGAKNAKAA